MMGWPPGLASSSTSSVPVITLAQLPALVAELARRIRAAGFQPELLVYIETGARLPAAWLAREFPVGAVPVVARRRGHGLKKLLAPLAPLVPRAVLDSFRRAEAGSGVHRRGGRSVTFARACDFRDRNILLVDDAADTGGTLRAVKAALVGRGADPARVRCAVLAATTDTGRAEADFFVSGQNSVLPWSTDSLERVAAQALMARTHLPGP
jgi:hypoxanthine phosphoribosyltransferase